MKIILITLFSLIQIKAVTLHPQAGTTSASFLRIPVGARAIGMGESFSAISNDVYAIYWNPAGLGQIKNKEVSFTYNMWLAEMHHGFLGFVFPYSEKSSIGASINYLHIGILEGRDIYDNPTGDFTAYDFSFGISAGNHFYEAIDPTELLQKGYVGGNLKMITEKIADVVAYGICIDFGMIFELNLGTRFSFVIQNLGPRIKYIQKSEPLPLVLKFGSGHKFFGDILQTSLELNKPIDNKWRVNAGIEGFLEGEKLGFTGNAFLRCGFKYQSGGNDDIGKLSGFSLGGGYHYSFGGNVVKIDYAFLPYGELGLTHRFSLSFEF